MKNLSNTKIKIEKSNQWISLSDFKTPEQVIKYVEDYAKDPEGEKSLFDNFNNISDCLGFFISQIEGIPAVFYQEYMTSEDIKSIYYFFEVIEYLDQREDLEKGGQKFYEFFAEYGFFQANLYIDEFVQDFLDINLN